jgi:DNA-binding NtrC family response regulator
MTEVPTKQPAVSMKPHVLVVDDHELRREWAKRALAGRGLKVVATSSTHRGIGYLRQVQFDAVVLSAHLRGMGVKEFQEKVHQLYPRTPVVVVEFPWPVEKDVTTLSPGAYHCLILCTQNREAALQTMVEKALAQKAQKAKDA